MIDGGAAWIDACGGTPKPSISRTVTVASGATYDLTGLVYVKGGASLSNLRVDVDGSAVTVTTGAVTANGWTPFSYRHTTTSTSLAFTGELAGDNSVFVDDLTLVAVP